MYMYMPLWLVEYTEMCSNTAKKPHTSIVVVFLLLFFVFFVVVFSDGLSQARKKARYSLMGFFTSRTLVPPKNKAMRDIPGPPQGCNFVCHSRAICSGLGKMCLRKQNHKKYPWSSQRDSGGGATFERSAGLKCVL